MAELKPYDYQEVGISYAMDKKRAILGDDVGCGKTVQAIMTVERLEEFPCLVICPATLKINWQREWKLWTTRKPLILNNSVRHTWPMFLDPKHNLFGDGNLADVVICNYESLKKYFVPDGKVKGKRLKDIKLHAAMLGFKSIIIDEIHRCKDASTQSAKLTKGLASGKNVILGLTGTPVVNKPGDLAAQLSIIDRLPQFGGATYFKNIFGKGENNKQLNELLNETCYIRREKFEVLKDLPDKVKTFLQVDLDKQTRELYDQAKEDIVKFCREHEGKQITMNARAQLMVKIIKLRQIAAMGKINHVRDYVNNATKALGKKVILFVWHTDVADALLKLYPRAVTVLGRDSQAEKQLAIDRFQNDPGTNIIICNIKAAGVGITLTAATFQLFVELPWTSADLVQAEGRAYRNGQKDSVNCIYFMGISTIDHWVFGKTETKRTMSNEISGSKEKGIDERVTQHDLMNQLFKQNFNVLAS